MLDTSFALVADGTALVRAAAAMVAVAMVLLTWVKTRAAIPVVVTALVGGFVLWAVTSDGLGWFSDRIDDDADRLAAASAVVQLAAAPPTLTAVVQPA